MDFPAKRYRLLFFTLAVPFVLSAQKYDTVSIFNVPIVLDTFIVRSSFDINAFISRVRSDTTFYKAFKSIRVVPYTATNDIAAYDNKNRIAGSLHSKAKQVISGNNCRQTIVLEQKSTGNFFKRNGDYNYYTAGLFAYLFFANKPICNQSDIVAGSMNEYGSGQMEKRKYELKQLIFNPGAKVSGIPFMGDRASIFDPGEAEKYNFKVERVEYNNEPCFVFRITPKAGFERKVLYDELTTWFRISDYSIVARDYSLSYHTLFYDFDVRMKVRTQKIGAKLYPTWISYDGNWHIFSKNRERVKFTVALEY